MLDLSEFHLSPLTVLGIASIIGLYAGFLVRRGRLPSILGYMILGVILGPSVLVLLDVPVMEHLSFITQVALGFVAFTIGAELSLTGLRKLGIGIVSIILAESFVAFAFVTAGVYVLTRDLCLALIFGAMAPASAPAGTVAVIQEYKAKGTLTQSLYAVVGFDDGLAIIIFGFASAMAKSLLINEATGAAGSILPALVRPLAEIGLSILVGAVIGFVFCQVVRRVTNPAEVLIVVFGTILIACGLSARWHLSLILTNMVVGFVLTNTRREAMVHRVTGSTTNVMPLLFLLFFCLAGAHLEIGKLLSLGTLGVMYIVMRSLGKIIGARLGAMAGDVEPKIKKYLGFGILSQAGVAIGLSLIVKHELDVLGAQYDFLRPAEIGAMVLTTITATCVFFEIVGPICTRIVLQKAGEIPEPPRKSLGA